MQIAIILLLCASYTVIGYADIRPVDEPCVSGSYPPKGRPEIPTYTIDLDAPPQERWKHLATDKRAEMQHLLNQLKSFLMILGNSSKDIINFIDKYLGFMASTFPAPFGDEIIGIAKAAKMPLGDIVLYNIVYEVMSACTSIVAHDAQGTVYHARNLDFGAFMGWNRTDHTWWITTALKPLIVNLEFRREKQVVYKAVSYAGYVGVITAMKPDVFTMSMNARTGHKDAFIGIAKWLAGFHSGKWMSFITRELMDASTSYSEARDTLIKAPLVAPGYYILGGNMTGEACVISRSRDKADDVWDMRKDNWYLLETNYDHWKAPLFLDDRRTPARKCMDKLGQQNVGFPGLFDVLSTQPVLNKCTTYTALMQVNSNKLESYLQYCPDPCVAW